MVAFVQSIAATGNGVASQNITLTGVTAGNFLALQPSVYVSGGPPNVTPTDDKSNTWNTTTAPSGPVNSRAFVNYAMNVAAGTTVISVDYGATQWINESASEYSGLATASALDVEASNTATNSTPTSGTTGTTSLADELVLATFGADGGSSSLGIDLPPGYTNLHIDQSGTNIVGHSSDYRIVSATGTQIADWGSLTASPNWSGKIATFKGASSAPASRPLFPFAAFQAVNRASTF